jgi:sulfate adenylyltransferase subunit 2
MTTQLKLNYLDQLESEAIFIIREAFAQLDKTVLLFSGGKDSLVLLHLARKAFFPMNLPFPVLHIDTGHNFQETLDFRDSIVSHFNLKLIVRFVEDSIKTGRAQEDSPINSSRNHLQSVTLLDAINEFQFKACFGGARRDEEKARAKERIFSFRNSFGEWNPKLQRPELWSLFNGHCKAGENFRIFALSNWTELDIWQYIKKEGIALPRLYFSHEREVLERNGTLLSKCVFVSPVNNEKWQKCNVRFRTIGDMTCTGAMLSEAKNIDEVIAELVLSTRSERGSRADDQTSSSAMEDRKKEGYF